MNSKEAISNLQTLINTAIQRGIFADAEGVFKMQSSLNFVAQNLTRFENELTTQKPAHKEAESNSESVSN